VNDLKLDKVRESEVASKERYFVVFASIVLTLSLGGCSESKSAQCQKISAIANSLVEETRSLSQTKELSNPNLDNWLQGAETIDRSARSMEELSLEDTQLVAYKNDWVKVQRNNARSTKDIVKAWQDRDLTAAEKAKKSVTEAGKLEQKVTTQINSYCEGN
jgi:outer membrane murein-binding lipoprotein Lpp